MQKFVFVLILMILGIVNADVNRYARNSTQSDSTIYNKKPKTTTGIDFAATYEGPYNASAEEYIAYQLHGPIHPDYRYAVSTASHNFWDQMYRIHDLNYKWTRLHVKGKIIHGLPNILNTSMAILNEAIGKMQTILEKHESSDEVVDPISNTTYKDLMDNLQKIKKCLDEQQPSKVELPEWNSVTPKIYKNRIVTYRPKLSTKQDIYRRFKDMRNEVDSIEADLCTIYNRMLERMQEYRRRRQKYRSD